MLDPHRCSGGVRAGAFGIVVRVCSPFSSLPATRRAVALSLKVTFTGNCSAPCPVSPRVWTMHQEQCKSCAPRQVLLNCSKTYEYKFKHFQRQNRFIIIVTNEFDLRKLIFKQFLKFGKIDLLSRECPAMTELIPFFKKYRVM